MHDFELLTLKDGRKLAFRRYGRRDGRPLYFFHGFPGCRLQAALVHAQAEAAGVSLIAIDRPGFGRSSFAPKRTIPSWPDDVAQLADRLGHRRFGVVGVSCGGAYALACAHRMRQRLEYVGLFAGMGPMDIAAIRAGQLPALTAMFALARIRPLLAAPFLVLDRLMFRVSPERAVRALAGMLTLPDRELLGNDAQVRRAFGASLAEAYAQGVAGALREAHLIGSARGFALEDIAGPVHVYQGGVDRHVPPAMGRYLAATIPQGRLHFHPQEGHLSILVNRFGDCLRDFQATAAAPIALSPFGAVADIGTAQSQSTAH